MLQPIQWIAEPQPHVRLLDQTLLPTEEVYREVRTVEAMWQSIKRLAVRGAPAIGIAAAYGVALAVLDEAGRPLVDRVAARQQAAAALDYLGTSRPTAVNLFWALKRMQRVLDASTAADGAGLLAELLAEARAIHDEDRALCEAIGRHGAPLIAAGSGVLTHCNTGALATGGIGTAIGVLRTAWDRLPAESRFRVFACETRPLLQGARLTAWELQRYGIDVTLLTDSMAGHCMQAGTIDAVIVGADRVAANGDVANKIGTYSHAVLAKHHGIPFYVAAPLSTFDRTLPDGGGIPIEERDPDEVRGFAGCMIAPPDVPCYAPAFDVTPAGLISALITEAGVLRPPFEASIADAFARVATPGRH